MTFETLDWKAEAERICLAFDLKRGCEFVGSEDEWEFIGVDTEIRRLCQNRLASVNINEYEDLFLRSTYYDDTGRYFEISQKVPGKSSRAISITIEWDGNVSPMIRHQTLKSADLLAKGLFHLGLLSPEVEAELRVSITAHQKLEWTLEYGRRVE